MKKDMTIRTYEILVDFFVRDYENGGIDDGRKMAAFYEATVSNRISPKIVQFTNGDPAVFRFKAIRSAAYGLFVDLCNEGIIDEDLKQDFDNAFEVFDFENDHPNTPRLFRI